jgi:hypothetical protein
VTPDEFDEHQPDEDVSAGESGQEDVRRLLAAAAADPPPIPDDVALRLDDVLAGLVAQRADSSVGEPTGSPVADLSERRARRWPRLLVAAAAVSVVALGVGNVLEGQGSLETGDMPTSGDAGSASDADVQSRPDSQSEDARGAVPSERETAPPQDEEATSEGDGRGSARLPRPTLRSASLAADAQRVADFRVAAGPSTQRGTLDTCVVPPTSQGDEMVAVRLDGEPATLVLRADEDGFRLADIYACDSAASPVASTSLDRR